MKKQKKKRDSKKLWKLHEQKRAKEILYAQKKEASLKKWFALFIFSFLFFFILIYFIWVIFEKYA